VTGRAIPARVVKRRLGDPPRLVASSRRARRDLGWQPHESSLEHMLADAWAWKLSHPTGYAKRKPRTPRHRGRNGAASQDGIPVGDEPTAVERVAARVSA